jgi:hypothetical protein
LNQFQATPVALASFELRQQIVTDLIDCLNQNLIHGAVPELAFIADSLDGVLDQKVTDWLKKHTDHTQKDIDRAFRNARIKSDIGGVPHYAEELVEIVVKRDNMNCLYNGQIVKKGKPFIEGAFVTSDEMKNPMIADKVYFACPAKVNLDAFMRQLRMASDKHRLAFADRAINDAVTEWVEKARRERRYNLFMDLAGPILPMNLRDDAELLWLEIANRLFTVSEECPAEFVVAVLKKFMHQVKRKLRGFPVYDHLMPVILGPQGKGKSTFVRKMLDPVRELVLSVDFKMIEDDRNIDIWHSYVLFLDEMGFASKANIDTIKNAITAETLTRKPLYTNSKVEIDQNATFIGCSNKKLEQLIKDPTGIRRFVALTYRNDPDWAFLNQIDWALMWKSVDHDGTDPMAGFKTVLAEAQEDSREMGRVEHWLDEFNPNSHPSYEPDARGRVRANLLHSLFRDFEDQHYPGPQKTSSTEMGHEMRRLWEAGMNTRFEYLGRQSGGYYCYRDHHAK